MDQTIADILANPDRWIGGELINFMDITAWPRDRDGNKIPEANLGGWPMRATITAVQMEDPTIFLVIGKGLNGRDFACNGPIDLLAVATAPHFPGRPGENVLRPGEVILHGAQGHEWHLIPKEA